MIWKAPGDYLCKLCGQAINRKVVEVIAEVYGLDPLEEVGIGHYQCALFVAEYVAQLIEVGWDAERDPLPMPTNPFALPYAGLPLAEPSLTLTDWVENLGLDPQEVSQEIHRDGFSAYLVLLGYAGDPFPYAGH